MSRTRATIMEALYNPRTVSLASKPAELISAATRLPLLAVPLFLAVGVQAAGTRGLLWGLLCLFLTSGLSLVYLFYLARTGKVRDPRSIARAERVRPLRVVAVLHVAAFLIVTLLGAPAELRAALLSYALATVLFALLAPFTNLSLHAAGVSGALVCLLFVFGARGVIFAPVLPLVWWARRFLGRHTHLELALGAAIGGGLTWAAFRLVA